MNILTRYALPFLLLLSACSKPADTYYQGYVEGEQMFLSSPQAGYLETLSLARGDHPNKGSRAYTLSGEQNPTASSTAAIEAQLHAAESALRFATTQLKRQEELAKQNFASAARTDELLTSQVQAAAQVRVLREQLSNRSVLVPATGEITEIYYRPGEWVAPGQPVASLLPDDKRRIRFFVAETVLATLQLGQTVTLRCDSCGEGLTAFLTHISAQAEYTPPVIYSQGSREKLLFRVEATPAPQDAGRLHPGLPVEVRLK